MIKVEDIDFKAAFKVIPATSVLLLPDVPTFTILEVTENFLQAYQLKEADVIGKGMFEIYPFLDDTTNECMQEHKEVLKQLVKNHLQDNQANHAHDGLNRPVFDTNGNLNFIIHTRNPVTEQIDRHTLGLFQNFLQTLPQVVWTNFPNGQVNFYNHRWYTYTGIPEQQKIMHHWKDYLHPDDRQEFIKKYESAIQNETVSITECRFKRENGDYHWHLIRISPVRNNSQEIWLWSVISTDIHERKNSKEELHKSEHRYRTLIEESTVATGLYIGREIKIQYANDIMLRYWGKDHSVIGKPIMEAIPELEGQPFLGLLQQVYDTGESYVGEEQRADLIVDGKLQTYYFNFTYKALRDKHGSIYGIHHMSLNVTDQVLIRKKIQESEERFRLMVQQSPVAMLVFRGENMVFETINKEMLTLVGRDDSIIGKPALEAMPELESQPVWRIIMDVYSTGESYFGDEFPVQLIKNGKPELGYYSFSYIALKEQGTITGILHVAVDVTAQVKARMQAEDKEAEFRHLVMVVPVGMCIASLNPINVEDVNESFLEFTGKTKEEFKRSPSCPVEKDSYEYVEILEDIFKTGNSHHSEENEITIKRNGKEETVYVSYEYVPIKDRSGIVKKVIILAIEVTDQVKLRKKIQTAVLERTRELGEVNRNLQQSNAELAQFAYIASHDLQEPLRKISTFAQMLELSLDQVSETTKDYLNKISSSTSRMSKLINDVLAYSQLGQKNQLYEMIDLTQIVKGVVTDYELLIEQKRATISYSNLPTVQAISLQMTQLFGNLLSNALKYSSKTQKPVITISATLLTTELAASFFILKTNSTYFQIDFKDNGIGFKQEYADRIFNIFQRLHGKTEFAGTGIGLAMCKKIVENHHGYIFASGAPDAGATFTILLPVIQ